MASPIYETIRRALASAGLMPGGGGAPPAGWASRWRDAIGGAQAEAARWRQAGSAPWPADADRARRFAERRSDADHSDAATMPGEPAVDETDVDATQGQFLARRHLGAAGSLAYKLYVPSRRAGSALPLVVMLHGCRQDADDFATGTRMNRQAERHGFLVAYPEQPAKSNGSNCWNWFLARDQSRGLGEPSLIAGIVRELVERDGADASRVFVAGLSAGAAMAVILGRTYPELVAAVGAHSGLPYGAAHDVGSAFAAMKRATPRRSGAGGDAASSKPVPTIVFHGDADATVAAANGEAIVLDAAAGLPVAERHRRRFGRREATRSVHVGFDGRPQAEHWVVHGAGHAWSGGDGAGSFTDGDGPDASAEMLRFFFAQR